MRFLSIYRHEARAVATPPTQDEMARMGALIEEGKKAGWLLATDGIRQGSAGTRVRLSGGKLTVTDGPFTEAKEVIGGYALLRAGSKEEVLALTRRFLEVAGGGACEVHELYGEAEVSSR